jgi:hypothetical protein
MFNCADCQCSPSSSSKESNVRQQTLENALKGHFIVVASTDTGHRQCPDVRGDVATKSEIEELMHLFEKHAIPSLRLAHSEGAITNAYRCQESLAGRDAARLFIPRCHFDSPRSLIAVLDRLIAGELLFPADLNMSFVTDQQEVLPSCNNRKPSDIVCAVTLDFISEESGLSKKFQRVWFRSRRPPHHSAAHALELMANHQKLLDKHREFKHLQWTPYDDMLIQDFRSAFPQVDVANVQMADTVLLRDENKQGQCFLKRWEDVIPDARMPMLLRRSPSMRTYDWSHPDALIPVNRLVWLAVEAARNQAGLNDVSLDMSSLSLQ